MLTDSRVGRFTIDLNHIERRPELARRMLDGLIVVRAEIRCEDNGELSFVRWVPDDRYSSNAIGGAGQ